MRPGAACDAVSFSCFPPPPGVQRAHREKQAQEDGRDKIQRVGKAELPQLKGGAALIGADKGEDAINDFDIDGGGVKDKINDSADAVLVFDKDGDGISGEDG